MEDLRVEIDLRVDGPTPAGYALPDEYHLALRDYRVNRRQFHWARNQTAYLDKGARPYLHLADGALADYIGVRAIENAYRRSDGFIRRRLNLGQIERLVLIIVNAGAAADEKISRRRPAPGWLAVAYGRKHQPG